MSRRIPGPCEDLPANTHWLRGNAHQTDDRRPGSRLGNPASVDHTETRRSDTEIETGQRRLPNAESLFLLDWSCWNIVAPANGANARPADTALRTVRNRFRLTVVLQGERVRVTTLCRRESGDSHAEDDHPGCEKDIVEECHPRLEPPGQGADLLEVYGNRVGDDGEEQDNQAWK